MDKKGSMRRQDFWRLGPVWVWKWLVLGVLLTLSLTVLAVFGLPWELFSEREEAKTAYRYDDPALRELSGVVCVLDGSGTVRYRGEVDAGSFTGTGQVFDGRGELVYDGPLLDGVREGANAKVYRNGKLVYEGEMARDLYEGQGRRTDPESGTVSEGTFSGGQLNGPGREYGPNGILLREGTFENGLLHGEGRLFDATLGTLLYEGPVSGGSPCAAAFLGLSLAEVEAAFSGHWLLCCAPDGSAAFVYPEFQLMFWTDGPVRLHSPAQQKAREEQERQELLDALATPIIITVPEPLPEDETSETVIEPEDTPLSEPPPMDFTLAPDTDKKELVIRAVLSYGGPLAGTPQPVSGTPVRPGEAGWREQFSDFAAGRGDGASQAVRTGPFVYEFPALSEADCPDVERIPACEGGVESVTVYREGENGAFWYQSAVRVEGREVEP